MKEYKTLEQYKDEVAQKCVQYPSASNPYYKDWDSMYEFLKEKNMTTLLLRLTEAAELHSQQYINTNKELTAENERLRESVKDLIQWNEKYPPNRVYPYAEASNMEEQLTSCINKMKSALNQ
jgi:hypothetical protein